MWIFVLVALALALGLLYAGKAWLAWVAAAGLLYVGWWQSGVEQAFVFLFSASLVGLLAVVTGVPRLRRDLITSRLLPLIAPILPRMSETERIAIEAGSVWWEAEFFTGRPDWKRLLNFQPQELSEKEKAFLDGPCTKVAQMVDEWDTLNAGDLPAEVWEYVKQAGFMGMIIPEKYGGLGFSAAAHSAVVQKLATRSVPLTVTVMVPNSLGPAELILHYGTDEQKNHYLPRLARGEEVPCFALTEPGAGSDAGSMTSTGVVCEGTFNGEKVLGMRLTWDKRYITLAPVATVLGLAFKLHDPDHLLGDVEDLGITCALIPASTEGVEIGERHSPLGMAFMNGPTRGEDVFVPLDFIIGGAENAGKGWLMLMQSLSAGRGISLPSMASGATKLATRTVGAYATVRKQFSTAIGKFEGIEGPLARIAGLTYAANAARRLTAGAVDDGEKPAVASAIVKCYLTESMRQATNDAMDIVGGAGISLGPRNILGSSYAALPIGITVEGANILTRSMIIFGQGAIRCHPFVQDEMRGAFEKDLERFDRAFFGHVGFVFSNLSRALVLGLTDGAFASSPVAGPQARYYKKLVRLSAGFALAADVAMGTLGGALKRKEATTGRLADVLAWMYLASASLKQFHDKGSKATDLPAVRWACEHALHQAQEAFGELLRNLPLRPAAWLLRCVVFPFGRRWAPPSDKLVHQLARAIQDGGELRERLTNGVHVPPPEELGLGQLEDALKRVVRANEVHAKIHAAVEEKRLEKKPRATLVERALAAGVIGDAERGLVEEAEEARRTAVAVDSFSGRAQAELSA
jgi:acyl-CoA dehydrogenase